MKIALFGGAFDPPHLGHCQVAESLISQKIVNEVWFVPVYKHPWAKKLHKEFLTSYEKRVEMLELMIEEINLKLENRQKTTSELRNENLGVVCERKTVWEPAKIAHFKAVSFTYDTLMYFSQKYPEHEFSWVMGSEYLPKFDKFLETHPKLLDFTFYIYPRKGSKFEPMYKNMVALEDMPEIDISSTLVRERVKNEEEIINMVSDKVINIIKKLNLYQSFLIQQ